MSRSESGNGGRESITTEQSADRSVEAVEAAFYRAFETGDADAMLALWHPAMPWLCVHPGGPRLADRDEVAASWRSVLTEMQGAVARFDDVLQWPAGSLSVAEVAGPVVRSGRERFYVEGELRGVLLATNVYQWCVDARRWFVVAHHASPDLRPTAAVPVASRLQ